MREKYIIRLASFYVKHMQHADKNINDEKLIGRLSKWFWPTHLASSFYSWRKEKKSIIKRKYGYWALEVMSRTTLCVVYHYYCWDYALYAIHNDNLNNNPCIYVIAHMYYLYIMSAKYTNQRDTTTLYAYTAYPPSF